MDILVGTALNYVLDVMKHLIVHHVIISTAVMSRWKKKVIIIDEIRKSMHEIISSNAPAN